MFQSFSHELMEAIYGPHAEMSGFKCTPGTLGVEPHATVYWNTEEQVLCQEVQYISSPLML